MNIQVMVLTLQMEEQTKDIILLKLNFFIFSSKVRQESAQTLKHKWVITFYNEKLHYSAHEERFYSQSFLTNTDNTNFNCILQGFVVNTTDFVTFKIYI